MTADAIDFSTSSVKHRRAALQAAITPSAATWLDVRRRRCARLLRYRRRSHASDIAEGISTGRLRCLRHEARSQCRARMITSRSGVKRAWPRAAQISVRVHGAPRGHLRRPANVAVEACSRDTNVLLLSSLPILRSNIIIQPNKALAIADRPPSAEHMTAVPSGAG